MASLPTVRIVHGPGGRLDRRGLRVAAPQTPRQLDAWCGQWAAAHRWAAESVWCDGQEAMVAAAAEPGADAVVLALNELPPDLDTMAAGLREATTAPLVELYIRDLRRRGADPSSSPVPAVYRLHGRGVDGYRDAIDHHAHRRRWPAQTVVYGSAPEQVADLRVPTGASGPHPVVVLFHGGFWLDAWGRDLCDALAIDLAEGGVATINVEYRRQHTGTWADTAADGRAVTDWIGNHAPEHALDPGRMVLMGHSAGGHLALWLAGELAAEGHPPALTVGLAPIVDLERARAEDLGAGAVADFFGDGPLEDADPRQRVPLSAPTLLVHPAGDRLVPPEHTRGYANAAGASVQLWEPDGGHFDLVDPHHKAWRPVADVITKAVST